MEAINASFASAQQVTLSGVAPATAYMVGYPYRDAGVLDTASLIQDPTFSPQGVWLAGPVGSLFGTGLNATAVLFLVNVSSFIASLATSLHQMDCGFAEESCLSKLYTLCATKHHALLQGLASNLRALRELEAQHFSRSGCSQRQLWPDEPAQPSACASIMLDSIAFGFCMTSRRLLSLHLD